MLRRFSPWLGGIILSGFIICMIWTACTRKSPMDPIESLLDETVLSNYFDSIIANPAKIKVGGSESLIRAHLVNSSGTALSNRTVQFSSTLGTTVAPAETKTDTSGWASAVLKSGSSTGTANVTATYEQTTTKSVSVQVVSATDTSVTDMQIYTEKSELLANGVENTLITVQLTAGSGQSLSGGTVAFSSTAGTITSLATINFSNQAIALLTTTASAVDINAIVTATFRDASKTAQVLFKGIQFSLEANPLTILADGKSESTIRIRLKETTSQIGITGGEVFIGRTLGDIVGSVTTDKRGVAEAQLTGTKPGISKVRAWYGKTFRDSVNVQLLESAPVFLDVTATPSVLPADGFSQSIIKAIVTDFNRNPVPDGTIVQFDIIHGSGTIIRQKTTINGVAESVFTASTKPDTALIAVHVGTLADTLTIYCKVGDPDNVLISSDLFKLPADGISNARIQARVLDSQGNPIQGVTVRFAATIGDITPSAPTDVQGIARAQYSSGVIGNATISASVQKMSGMTVTGTIQIQLLPGKPNSIQLRFNPESMGVKETGQNQTVEVSADVRDGKNNAVEDGTLVRFLIYAGPGGGESLSSTNPIPTVGGTAKVSLSSGIRSGDVRVQAEVNDANGIPLNPSVKAISTKLIIHAGPPYIEDIQTPATTHLTIVGSKLNIWAAMDTTAISMMLVDKYNNPVETGTAVYLTTSGGGINTHTAYTNEYGKAQVTLTAGNPQPTVNRFYYYLGMQNPNLGGKIDGPIPDFDSDGNENEGVARVIAYAEGIDEKGSKARAWDQLWVVYSWAVHYYDDSEEIFTNTNPQYPIYNDTLFIGEAATFHFGLMDFNGNPIESNSTIKLENATEAQAKVSPSAGYKTGVGMGVVWREATISNAIDPKNKKPGWTHVTVSWEGKHQFGSASSYKIFISDTTRIH